MFIVALLTSALFLMLTGVALLVIKNNFTVSKYTKDIISILNGGILFVLLCIVLIAIYLIEN